MALKPKQKQALDLLKKGHNVFLSGEAGTGKSFVIEEFKKYLDSIDKKYIVGAPTGLAALNVGGITLHRMFGLSTNPLDFKATMKNVDETEVIIIDEISMCRVDNFQKIASAIFDFENPIEEFDIKREAKVVRKKQIVVVGDFFQLPPVLTDKDAEILGLTQETIYPFQCEEWDRFNFKNVVLDEVVRQSDKDYIDNLNLIRKGNIKGLGFIEKKSRKTKIKNAIHLCSKNKDADLLNESNLNKIKFRERTYWANETGEVKNEDRATQKCLKLKVGARVMSLVNIKEDVVNGMLGTVKKLFDDSVVVEFDNGIEHEFKKYKWEIQGFKKEKIKDEEKTVTTSIGTFEQIPLKLAWAITIHKSQGQTYEAVNLSPECFCVGQLYVGLSRAKDLKKLHLTDKINPSNLKASKVVKDFYNKIEQEQQEDSIDIEEVEQYQEEYVSIKVPRRLEDKVLRLIEGKVDNNIDSKEIECLKRRIEELELELGQVKASSKRRPKISREIEEKIIELRKQGLGMNKIARAVGCGDGTVRRVIIDNGMK